MHMEHENTQNDKDDLGLLKQDALQRLEWHRLTEYLAASAIFPHTKDLLQQLKPDLSNQERNFLTQATAEALELYKRNIQLGLVPFSLESFEKSLPKGALLPALALYQIFLVLRLSQSLLSSLKQAAARTPCETLQSLALELKPQPYLLADIQKSVDEKGDILSSASAELKAARARLEHSKRKITEQLDKLINQTHVKEALQDPIWVLRDGRYVLPVRTDRKSNVDGISRGVSQSGSTLFIEPNAIANEYILFERAQSDVEVEEHKVIKDLSQKCYLVCDDIITCTQVLTQFDEIFARAQFTRSIEGEECHLLEGHSRTSVRFSFLKAKHPLFLLEKKKCTPNDLELSTPNIWVISGPNAGGKTVAMKTVGLCVLMAKAGLYIPCEKGQCLNFDSVFVELGDRQSRQDDLSSFSGHLLQIKKILEHANDKTLILLDEGFIGTDPAIGMALARATLEYLAEKNATVVITTHFSNLKQLSDSDPRFLNASMEFEPKSLSPTYKLLNGIPGQSYALELAQRMKLDPKLIEKARSYFGGEAQRMENMLSDLQKKRIELDENLKNQNSLLEKLQIDAEKFESQRKHFVDASENLVDSYRNKLQKRLNAFENRLEIRTRQFEREKEALLKKVEPEVEPVVEKEKPVESKKRETPKGKKLTVSSFEDLEKFQFQKQTAQEEEKDLDHQLQRTRQPKKLTSRALLDEANESLDFLKKSFSDIEKKFQSEAHKISQTTAKTPQKPAAAHVRPPEYWKAGMKVKCPRFQGAGVVLRPADHKGNVECQFGLVKVKIPSPELIAL